MVTREMSLKNFLDKADEVITGKYLFAAKKISEMLNTVSSSRILFEVFDFCCREDEAKLRDAYFYNENGRSGFIPPEDQRHIVALGFYVLKDIADGDTDYFNNFLLTYFPAADSLIGSYGLFINAVVVPFRNAVKNIVESVIMAKNMKDNREGPVRNEEKPNIENQYLVGLVTLLEEDIRNVSVAAKKDKAAKDMMTVLEPFVIAARLGDVKQLPSLFTGYKYIAARLKRVKTHTDEIEELLADHGLIEG